MKKLFTLLSLIALFVIDCQAQTVIINTGTAGTPAYNAGPIYRSSAGSAYDASRYTYLYTAAELSAAGITAGSVINLVGWAKNNTATTTGGGIFRIYMKNTSAVNFSLASETWANLNASATQVYENLSQDIPATAAPNYIDFPLTTPFIYTGGSLEISTEWDINQVSGSPTTGTFEWLWSTVVDRIYGTGNTTLAPITTLSSTTNSISTIDDRRPFIKITYSGGTTGIDVGAISLVAPTVAPNNCYTSTEPVSIKIRNFSTNPIDFSVNPLTVTTTVSGAISQVLTGLVNSGTLAAASTLDVNMTGTLNMSATGVYTFNASAIVAGDVTPSNNAMPSADITKAPLSAGTISASPSSYCVTGGTPTLSAAGASGYGSLQWQQSTTPGAGFTNIAGATTTPYTLSSAITQTMYYRLVASCNGSNATSGEATATLNSPQITSTTPGQSCGPGPVTVTLRATGTGAVINWYDVATGGVPVGTGTSFVTPPISANTTYYVATGSGGGTTTIGLPAKLAPSSGAGTTNFGLVFDALAAFTLNSVVVYPVSTTAGVAGTVTIDVIDGSGTVLHTATVDVVGNPTASATAQTVSLNFNILPGTNLKLRPGARSAGITGLLFEPSATAPGGNYGYPFAVPGVVSINHSTLSVAPGNGARLDLYYYFYNWEIATGCESARTAVLASIVAAPSATIAYAGSPYCTTDGTATVTRTGTSGGTYSSAAGLNINASTGAVTLASSTPGVYTVTYTIAATASCPLFTTTGSITVDNCSGPCASITTIACATPATAILVGAGVWSPGNCGFTTPGNEKVYSFTPTATGIHALQVTAASGGFVDYFYKAASGGCSATGWTCITNANGTTTATMGTLTVGVEYLILLDAEGTGSRTHTFQINCPAVVCPTATIAYTGSPFCQTAGPVMVMQTGTAGGTYSAAPAGLSINSSTGTITPSTSTAGTYTITYTIAAAGPCPVFTTTTNVAINAPVVNQPTSQVVCNNAATMPVTFTGSAGAIFNWTNSAPSIGLAASGTGNIASFTATNTSNAPVVATVTVTPSTPGGGGGGTALVPELLYYKFDGAGTSVPNLATAPPAGTSTASISGAQTQGGSGICNGTLIGTGGSSTNDFVNTNWTTDLTGSSWTISLKVANITPGTALNYLFGDNTAGSFRCFANGAAGAGNLLLRGPINDVVLTGGAQLATHTSTFVYDAVAGNIKGYLDGTLVTTVAQTPVVIAGTGPFKVGGYAGTSGLPAGSLLDEFRLYNRALSAADVQGLTACSTGTSGVCSGVPKTFTYTVNPTPAVNSVPNKTECNNTTTAPIAFSSPTTGGTVTYNWTNSNPAIGLAASGSGNIPAYMTTNPGTAPITATISVTPSYSNAGVTCVGTASTFTITVNPTPNVNQPANQIVCVGEMTAPVTFAGTVPGTTFEWMNSNTATGLAASGTGNIAAFTTTNTTNAPLVSTVTVTPYFGAAGGGLQPELLHYKFNGSGTTVPNLALTPPAGTATATISGGQSQGGTGICDGTLIGTGGSSNSDFVNTNWATNLTGTSWTISLKLANITPGTSLDYLFGDNTAGSFRCFANGAAGAGNLLLRGNINDVIITGGAATAAHTSTFVYDAVAGNIKGYLDGTLVTTVAQTPVAISGTGPFKVGGYSGSSGLPAGSLLDEFRLYSRALSAADVQALTACVNTSAGCAGPAKTFTITVNPVLSITCPANQTLTSAVGSCSAVATYAPVVTGAPAPVITYSFSGATTGTGTGTGSGRSFNVGVTTVTLTATNVCGTKTCSFTITVNDGQLPVITAQPTTRSACESGNTTLSVTATNAVSYQWEFYNGTTWVAVAGATSATYTVNNLVRNSNTNTYRVKVIGLCTTITSGNATIFVLAKPQVSIVSNQTSVIPGSNFVLTAVVDRPAGTGSYVWFKNGVVIPGVTSGTLPAGNIDDRGTYKVTYTDANGCVNTSADFVVSSIPTLDIFVYPNPSNGQFQIRYNNLSNEEATIFIYNESGQAIYQRKMPTGTQTYGRLDVNISNMAAGTYVIKLINGAGSVLGSKRIVKSN